MLAVGVFRIVGSMMGHCSGGSSLKELTGCVLTLPSQLYDIGSIRFAGSSRWLSTAMLHRAAAAAVPNLIGSCPPRCWMLCSWTRIDQDTSSLSWGCCWCSTLVMNRDISGDRPVGVGCCSWSSSTDPKSMAADHIIMPMFDRARSASGVVVNWHDGLLRSESPADWSRASVRVR